MQCNKEVLFSKQYEYFIKFVSFRKLIPTFS